MWVYDLRRNYLHLGLLRVLQGSLKMPCEKDLIFPLGNSRVLVRSKDFSGCVVEWYLHNEKSHQAISAYQAELLLDEAYPEPPAPENHQGSHASGEIVTPT